MKITDATEGTDVIISKYIIRNEQKQYMRELLCVYARFGEKNLSAFNVFFFCYCSCNGTMIHFHMLVLSKVLIFDIVYVYVKTMNAGNHTSSLL